MQTQLEPEMQLLEALENNKILVSLHLVGSTKFTFLAHSTKKCVLDIKLFNDSKLVAHKQQHIISNALKVFVGENVALPLVDKNTSWQSLLLAKGLFLEFCMTCAEQKTIINKKVYQCVTKDYITLPNAPIQQAPVNRAKNQKAAKALPKAKFPNFVRIDGDCIIVETLEMFTYSTGQHVDSCIVARLFNSQKQLLGEFKKQYGALEKQRLRETSLKLKLINPNMKHTDLLQDKRFFLHIFYTIGDTKQQHDPLVFECYLMLPENALNLDDIRKRKHAAINNEKDQSSIPQVGAILEPDSLHLQ